MPDPTQIVKTESIDLIYQNGGGIGTQGSTTGPSCRSGSSRRGPVGDSRPASRSPSGAGPHPTSGVASRGRVPYPLGMETTRSALFERIEAARERLAGVAHRTPVMRCRALDEAVSAEVYLKCESFQRAGAFKFRGAYNTMSQLSGQERARGVVTHSSGNHAQAVALAGKLLGIATTIVMPKDAPVVKRRATEAYGAEVVEYDPGETTREEVSARIQRERNPVLVPPFDHEEIVAGQGTAAAELFEEVGDLDFLLAPCGGGGLLSGSAIAAKALAPRCRVVGAEPEQADDATRSFRTRTLQTVRNPRTIADGTRTPSLGELTFRCLLDHVDEMQTVSEEAIVEAVRFLFYRAKLVVEPSGALGVAALLAGRVPVRGRAGVILSGGNVDGSTMAEILREG